MCGRFTLTASPEQLQAAFAWLNLPAGQMLPRYNIAPMQPVAVVANDGQHRLDFYHWGLVPAWATSPEIGSRLINARAETLAEKPAFRVALRRRRCLVLADGFYEWHQEAGQKIKTPFYIRLADGRPFAFAGLWDNWQGPDGSAFLSCTIITTEPNELMRSLHHRMPVILPPQVYAAWLEAGEQPVQELLPLLQPYPAEAMRADPVARLVNSPANDTPECIQPISDAQ